MESLKNTKLYKELVKEINALREQKDKGVEEILKELYEQEEKNLSGEYYKKIMDLLQELTKVSRRKTLRENIQVNLKSLGSEKEDFSNLYVHNRNATIGINPQGLGVAIWGSQLTPLNDRYAKSRDSRELNIFRWICDDEELCLDIADAINRRNRKDFLLLCKHVRENFFVGKEIDLCEEIELEENSRLELREKLTSCSFYNEELGRVNYTLKTLVFGDEEEQKKYLETLDFEIRELLVLKIYMSNQEKVKVTLKERIKAHKKLEEKNLSSIEEINVMSKTYEALKNL